MTFQVFLSEKAQRDLDVLSDKIVGQILADCTRLGNDPVPDGKRIKKLQGFKESLYRLRAEPPICELRVGDYRVFYDVAEEERVMYIRAIRKKPAERTTEDIL